MANAVTHLVSVLGFADLAYTVCYEVIVMVSQSNGYGVKE
jgi:hypothetical protein